GGRYRNSAPAAFMSCSTLGPLWLDRLSMTTMSPFERVGTRHFSTHSSNEAALIGRSKAFWATRTAKAQAGDERNRLVMAVRNGGAQPSAAPPASAFARHIRRSPGVSRPKEFHLRPLAERCVNLSIHTAPIR